MARPRSPEWLARQREGVRRAAREGKYSHPRDPESVEKTAAKLRGKPRPPEVVEKISRANLGKNLFRKRSPETLAKMSAAIKESWKQRPLEQRERIRQIGLANRGKKPDPIQGKIHSIKMWGRKRDPEIVAIVAGKMRGRPQTAELTKKGATHVCSSEGFLRSPDNVVYAFRNLTQFVRDHEELFLPEDVVWKKTGKRKSREQCRASKGLQALFARKFIRSSWKGWVKCEYGPDRPEILAKD